MALADSSVVTLALPDILREFDVDAGKCVWATFGRRKAKGLAAAVEEPEACVRDQLGDARSFSLDSPKSRVARLESLRKMGH